VSRILLLTSGTRGDVQPFVALGRALRRAGHDPVVCTHERFRPFVERHGVRYALMTDDLLRFGDTPEGRALTEGRGNALAALRTARPIYARMLRDAEAAAEGAEIIVHHPKTLAGPSLAEAHDVPAVLVLPVPAMTPTAAFALPLVGDRDVGRVLNRATYWPLRFSTSAFSGVVNAWRRSLGLEPDRARPPHVDHRGRPVPTLYPVSPHVVPRPADWPANTLLTGYWFLDDDAPTPPPDELAAFLEAGPAPVVIGFGSMSGGDAARRTRLVTEAVATAGVRAVLVTGWGGLAVEEPARLQRLLAVREAPFAWLFPRAAAVVHHGGAGTTAEGVRAGVPSLACTFFGDQPFWGSRLARLGVGPAPIGQRRLTAERLAAALAAMSSDGAMRERARALGAKVRREDGLGVAVERIESWCQQRAPRRSGLVRSDVRGL